MCSDEHLRLIKSLTFFRSRKVFLFYALIGAPATSILACIPALHFYYVVGLFILLGAGASTRIGPEELSVLMAGMITGYAMLNTVPSIFFSVSDDSTFLVVLLGQKYLLQWTQ